MDNKKLLSQIGDLIDQKLDEKLDQKLEPIKKQLNDVEMKVELVNKKVDSVEEKLLKAIEKSQEETIDALTELMNSGYTLHEKRIKRVEEHLHLPPIQQ